MTHPNEERDAQTIELMRAEGESVDVINRFETVLRFAREHTLLCSGNPREKVCDKTPVTVIILHGRPFALQCFDCVSLTTHVIMYMGHGSCRHDGFNHFPAEWLEKASGTWAEHFRRHGMAIPKGRHWSFMKQKLGERELDNTLRAQQKHD